MQRYYPALVHKERGSDYGVSFPDFPGCVSAGATQSEAVALAQEALELHVRGMLDDGDPLPEPTALEDLDEEARDGGVPALVGAVVPSRQVRVNVSLDESALQQIDGFAKAEGLTRSGFLERAAEQYVETIKAAGRERYTDPAAPRNDHGELAGGRRGKVSALEESLDDLVRDKAAPVRKRKPPAD